MKWLLLLLLMVPVFGIAQIITTVAGTGMTGYSGDGNSCLSASLYSPQYLVFDASGNLLIAERGNNIIRKINASGIISTFSGNGIGGYTGDGMPATLAELHEPPGIAIDNVGNLFIADGDNNVIRKVNSDGVITTIAGVEGMSGISGDGGPATAAYLGNPYGIIIDNSGSLYISGNFRVRKISASGIISTIAGNGTFGYNGDGMPATSAQLSYTGYIAITTSGEIYIPDWSNHRVRKVSNSGIISTIAGNGISGNNGDGATATAAELNAPNSVNFDDSGNYYICDALSNVIRKVNSAGIISTIAGNGAMGFSGDGGFATEAQFNRIGSVAFNSAGNMFIADGDNNRIRKITYRPEGLSNIKSPRPVVAIYPNPTHNEITIRSTDKIESIAVVNMVGQEVETPPRSTSNEKEVLLNVALLPSGVYFVKVNGLYGGKFVKE